MPTSLRALPAIQAGLYDEVVRKGWFSARPDATRGRWHRIGWVALGVAVAVAALLIAFTAFGLAGLVLVVLAVLFSRLTGFQPGLMFGLVAGVVFYLIARLYAG